MSSKISNLKALNMEKDNYLVALEAEMKQVKEEYEAETDKIRREFAEGPVKLQHAQLKTEYLTTERYHLSQLYENFRILKSVTPGFKGQTRVHLKCVLGSSLTHMMTHRTETNVTSFIYNKVLYKITKQLHHTNTTIQQP